MQALECSKGISSAATQRTRFIGACVRGPRRIDSCSARRHLTKLAGSSVDPQPLDALRDAVNSDASLKMVYLTLQFLSAFRRSKRAPWATKDLSSVHCSEDRVLRPQYFWASKGSGTRSNWSSIITGLQSNLSPRILTFVGIYNCR